MISFERSLKFVTGMPVMASLFFFSLFLPAISLLINGMFTEAGVAAVLTVGFVFGIGMLVDSMSDTPFITLVLSCEFAASAICGLMINFTTGGALIILQVIAFSIVTSDTITELHDDVCVVLKHKDELFDECLEVEKNTKTP